MTELLRLDDVHLRYAGGVKALDGVSLEVGTELVGLLGPNGAGKTTLLNVLARRLRPQRGQGLLRGIPLEDPRGRGAWLQQVHYLPQQETPPPHLSGREVVELALALARPEWPRRRRRETAAQTLERVGLGGVGRRRAISYSGGMRRRLGLARVLAPQPTLLLVDEPTSGLDPEERVAFRDLLSAVAELSAVIVSTHIAADVEVSCTRVVVFLAGRVVWDGAPSELLAGCAGRVRSVATDEGGAAAVAEEHRVTGIVRDRGAVRVRFLASASSADAGDRCTPTLEEAYIDLVSRHGAAAEVVP